ncbi:hypothetical protein FV223_29840 [Methylobacterium sp. WL116]|nr:hypothetical protein FV223_29840 [Methylobacterium sp. WL116]
MKQATLKRLLADRAARPAFYAEADYRAIEATGPRADNVVAYLRSDASADGDIFVAVPRLVAGLVTDATWSGAGFAGTTVDLGAGTSWHDIVTGAGYDGSADLAALFSALPYAVLRRRA